jgi:2-oxoglutarate ferredoxin oxidoreductase subunit gamma
MMTGIGGQGIQLSSKTLAMAAIAEGRQSLLLGSYSGAMRGGQTDASVVVADQALRALPILERTWSAMAMHPDHWPSTRDKVRPGGVIVVNSSLVHEVGRDDCAAFAVPANTIADGVGASLGAGYVLLAAYCAITGLVGVESLVGAMRQLVPPYRTQHLVANEAALRAGFDAAPALAAPAWDATSLDPVRA